MEIKFHGQSCFELSNGETTVLTDPFLKPNNPAAVATAEEVNATHVAISHGHADHVADAVAVLKRTGAEAIAIVELANWLGEQGVESVKDPNFGGTVEYEWGYVSLVPAWHTNTLPDGTVIGPPAGLVIKIGETTVYHAGDTCLFSDMKLIAERSDIDVFLVPIGGHYTMDRRDAVRACEFVGAPTVIPMHYDTFPPIETDAEAFKSDVESQTSSRVVVLEPGESHSV
ncbi:MAG TPA: metal-dependent hydrolase [Solirubrobacterales bacterium]|nr:metal-dependent hydrolase [Solirubrobacterales bacterium]